MIDYKLTIGGVDYTQYMPYCFSDKEALDESLDMSHIELLYTTLIEPIKPLTEVIITLTQGVNTKTITRYVAIDKMTEVISHGFTNHDLLLIETTKITERMFVGGKTVTQPFLHAYAEGATYVVPTINITEGSAYIERIDYPYISPLNINSTSSINLVSPTDIIIFINGELFWNDFGAVVIKTKINGTQVDEYTYQYPNPFSRSIELDTGEVEIDYTYALTDGNAYFYGHIIYTLSVINQESAGNYKSITNEVDKLLKTVECLTENETPQFTFYNTTDTDAIAMRDFYSTIKSPEFTFSKMSLWEALSQVASYVQAIPYLEGNEVRFFKIDTNKSVSQILLPYSSQTKTHDIEQFCSSLDANIDNILNSGEINETNIGTEDAITEPFEGGFQTLRTESGTVVIEEDNCFIETKYPIGRIVKVECGYLKRADNEDQILVGDITPYVYESTEYGVLSSFSSSYPYAKSYAIKWTYGERNITGLNFKVENAVNPVFSSYSIVNIICRKLNKPYTWWDNLMGTIKMYQLQFRVTYLPLVDARLKQTKPYTEDQNNYSIAYNQNANVVDSKAIGENLKGAIARFGNVDISKSYIIGDITQIPHIGDRFDDNYYISTITTEYYRQFVICELGLAKNFNRYSQYVGVRNNLRFFEVSERQALDRYIIREDFCTISENIINKTNNKAFYLNINNYINNTTTNSLVGKITSVGVKTYYREEEKEVILPVIGLGVGNSTILSFKFEDNYSVGNQATTNENIWETLNGNPIKTQQYVPYGDTYGNIDYISLEFYGNSPTGYVDNNEIKNHINNYNSALLTGDGLPIMVNENTYYTNKTIAIRNNYYENTQNPIKIIVDKDNREVIHFTYQIHYVTDNKNYIVGSGLGKYNGFLKENFDMNTDYKLVVLNQKLDGLSTIIDDTNIVGTYTDFSVQTGISGVSSSDTCVFTSSVEWQQDGSAWAFIYTDENGVNQLIFGKNCDIVKNEEADIQTYLNFTHKIKEN